MSRPTIKNIDIDGSLYTIKYFFDSDTTEDGIDIYEVSGKEEAHLGEVVGVEFPDSCDKEAMDNFKEHLKIWLQETNNI